ncbi:MAG TPA: lytic transglycosylase domain-containing protein [bacterium]|nr:lytic transglycosylase domain-containing protein [bacterium]
MMLKGLKNLFFLFITVGMIFPASLFLEKKDMADVRVISVLEKAAQNLNDRTRAEVARAVTDLSKTYGIDPLLILAVMKVESTFNPNAVSSAQAYGFMQVRKIVVKDVATEMGIDPKDDHKLRSDQGFNLRVGVHYLSKLIIKFGGDLKKALMAYNAGPTSVERNYKGRSVPEGGYQGRVLKAYRDFSDS